MSAAIDFKQKKGVADILPAVCLDIETCHASREAIDLEISLWKAPGNWKPETVEKNRAEYVEKVAEKSALLDTAPIASIALCDTGGESVVMHWLNVETGVLQPNCYSQRLNDERSMLISFREWADNHTDDQTAVVGHNLGFDLPHLRIAYMRHKLRLPRILNPRSGNPKEDVMFIFARHFTGKSQDTKSPGFFIRLDEVVKRLGIAQEGKLISGAEVPNMVQRGFDDGDAEAHRDVVTYNAIDTLITMRAWLMMTGQAEDLE